MKDTHLVFFSAVFLSLGVLCYAHVPDQLPEHIVVEVQTGFDEHVVRTSGGFSVEATIKEELMQQMYRQATSKYFEIPVEGKMQSFTESYGIIERNLERQILSTKEQIFAELPSVVNELSKTVAIVGISPRPPEELEELEMPLSIFREQYYQSSLLMYKEIL